MKLASRYLPFFCRWEGLETIPADFTQADVPLLPSVMLTALLGFFVFTKTTIS